jgi:hypothetical protein
VNAAVQSVLHGHHLTMVESAGDPLDGGVLVYGFGQTGTGVTDRIAHDLLAQARIDELRVRHMPLDAGSCVVTLSAPLAVARRMHFGLGAALTTGGGVVGGWALGAIGAAVVVPLAIGSGAALASIAGAILLGAGAGGTLGATGSRAAYRDRQDRGRAALERVLVEVDRTLRTPSPDPS